MKYPMDGTRYEYAEHIGTEKAILHSRHSEDPIRVAKVSGLWWVCDNDWNVNFSCNLQSWVMDQLDIQYQRYLSDLIVDTNRTHHA